MTMTMGNQTAIRRHKGSGIASFVIGAASVALVLALVGTAGVMTKNGTMTPEISMIVGLGVISACLIDLIGLGLGVFGTVDRSSKKVYPVLGLVLNTMILVVVGGLIAVGMAMQAS